MIVITFIIIHNSIFIRSNTNLSTTIPKMFETKSSFHVKQYTMGKVEFLIFSSFLLVLTKFSFWEEDWALGYTSMKL